MRTSHSLSCLRLEEKPGHSDQPKPSAGTGGGTVDVWLSPNGGGYYQLMVGGASGGSATITVPWWSTADARAMVTRDPRFYASESSGTFTISGVVGIGSDPGSLVLGRAYPNPVAVEEEVSLSLTVPEPGSVTIQLLSVSGRLMDEEQSEGIAGPGEVTLRWRLGEIPPGLYFLRVHLASGSLATKLLIF